MATFRPNPNDSRELWIEKAAFKDSPFRVWHLMFFAFSGFVALVILVCCCFKFRIPRTKQEVEADYRRKQLAGKFRKRLKLIQNEEMDAMDLRRALELIMRDFEREKAAEDGDLEVVSVANKMVEEPQGPVAGTSRMRF